MTYQEHIWKQLKNTSADDFIRTLKKDGWVLDAQHKTEYVFYCPSDGRRVSIHFQPRKTYGPKLVKYLFDQIHWTEDDLRRLKLIR